MAEDGPLDTRVTPDAPGPAGVPAPRVTIVTAAYQAAATLGETIDSVAAQAMDAWELVIVDDGSTDATRSIAEERAAADPRIRVLAQANAGTAAARNAGWRQARAGWLCFLDADDTLEPRFLERLLAAAPGPPPADIVSCNADYLLPDGTRTSVWHARNDFGARDLTVVDQLRESSILLMSLVRRELCERLGGFRDLHSEDYDFWLRALAVGARHRYVDEVLAVYRRQEGSKTRALVASAESILRILLDARDMPELTDRERAEAGVAIMRASEIVERRKLEEALLAGRYDGARGAYIRHRAAFPDPLKYWVGFAIMMVSPALYARVKAGRMI